MVACNFALLAETIVPVLHDLRALRDGGYRVEELREPPHPETGEPLSLLVIATPV